MNRGIVQLFFALLRSAISGAPLSAADREAFAEEQVAELLAMAEKHDIANLIVLALQQNDLLAEADASLQQGCKKRLLKAVYRYEQFQYEFVRIRSKSVV